MSNYVKDQDAIASALGITTRAFRNLAKKSGAPTKSASGYNVTKWKEFHRESFRSELSGDGSLRDEKTLREIKKLDIQIEEMRGDLVNRKEEEARFEAVWQRARKSVEDFRGHQTAKHPERVEEINALCDGLIDCVREA